MPNTDQLRERTFELFERAQNEIERHLGGDRVELSELAATALRIAAQSGPTTGVEPRITFFPDWFVLSGVDDDDSPAALIVPKADVQRIQFSGSLLILETDHDFLAVQCTVEQFAAIDLGDLG